MDWKAFAIGVAVGGLAGAGIGYWLGTRWEIVEEDDILEVEPKPAMEDAASPEENEDESVQEIRIAETIRKYQPFAEDLADGVEREYSLVELFDQYALEEQGVAPSEVDTDAYVISNITYDTTKDSWDKIHLTYYPDYDLVVTDEEDISHDPRKCFGDLVVDFVKDNSAQVISRKIMYVRNGYLSTDYEVDVCRKVDADGWIADYLEGLDG